MLPILGQIAVVRSASSSGPKTMIITSGSTFTVPSDWNSANNTIHCIGAGGNGSASAMGGGGAYASKSNVSLTPGASVSCQLGTAGGSVVNPGGSAHTWVVSNTTLRATGANVVSGGSSSLSVGDITFSGGDGGNSTGGGGAAGPNGAGVSATSAIGGAGDAGFGGAGGAAGGNGGDGAEWTDNSGGANNGLTAGSGGGVGYFGAQGGNYGGGGSSSSGKNGLIVLEWTP